MLDENLPHDLVEVLTGHDVSTVQKLGWAGTKNGALLTRASGHCDVFVTMDGNIEWQQNLAGLAFGVVVVSAPSNRIADLRPLVPEILKACDMVRPGEVRRVGTAAKGRGRSTRTL
ncbi:MAG: DUF5615 family PIN-like protein [Acidobacteria bacterium]|nr:DUF5615 family PIN-like protein [Acidobacteriota bacterium]